MSSPVKMPHNLLELIFAQYMLPGDIIVVYIEVIYEFGSNYWTNLVLSICLVIFY